MTSNQPDEVDKRLDGVLFHEDSCLYEVSPKRGCTCTFKQRKALLRTLLIEARIDEVNLARKDISSSNPAHLYLHDRLQALKDK